ncbi:hypothetical protein NC653_018852 [Populus alba x Populus x berolinensis]|uniref:Uncharacterized protein n=1 Tax=Populus alba x Populus x berolinensis TaxID=444605 RepID=A0AAD6QHE1_9ROSI|nr:hypothetical protein NC653_018852 [Populus alba x Populus x berolinensis]
MKLQAAPDWNCCATKVLTVCLARRSRHQDSGVTAILQWQFGSSWDVSGGAHNEVFVKSEATCLQSCGV